MPLAVNVDVGRSLRWYLPSWLGLSALTMALTVTHVARPAIAVLWIALFLGSVAAIALLVVADELAEPSTEHGLPPFQSAYPLRLPEDVLPPARSKPRPVELPMLRRDLPLRLFATPQHAPPRRTATSRPHAPTPQGCVDVEP
jgi:hypothetical protein